jgi:hypothetical protein
MGEASSRGKGWPDRRPSDSLKTLQSKRAKFSKKAAKQGPERRLASTRLRPCLHRLHLNFALMKRTRKCSRWERTRKINSRLVYAVSRPCPLAYVFCWCRPRRNEPGDAATARSHYNQRARALEPGRLALPSRHGRVRRGRPQRGQNVAYRSRATMAHRIECGDDHHRCQLRPANQGANGLCPSTDFSERW